MQASGGIEAARTLTPTKGVRSALQDAFEVLRHGLIVVNATGRVEVFNRKAAELLRLPRMLKAGEVAFSEIVEHLAGVDVIPGTMQGRVTALIASERLIELSTVALPGGGAMILVEDVSLDRKREQALLQAEAEYRSLFENAVYGIYRDALDGTPLRANAALARIYGYETEEQLITALQQTTRPWYVEAGRRDEFLALLQRDGMVTDFVSEVFQHKTGERRWITENAWYVRDGNGEPRYVEGTMLDATERIRASEALQRHADFDSLTGAASRFSFLQRLDRCISIPGARLLIYCIDLDLFKDINDFYGHAAGDAVLSAVAERLSYVCGKRDGGVARLGGDEFAIMSTNPRDLAEPGLMADEIIAAMRRPFSIDGQSHQIGASVGVSIFPDHGISSSDLLRNADTALYEAKAAGRNGWRLFDNELRLAQEEAKAIKRHLRDAVQNDELSLHYQAVHDVKTGKIAGFEALMRWDSTVLGEVRPSAFIPIAEQSGLMRELGEWAIARACEGASALGRNYHVSVNLSASQFRSPNLIGVIERELKRNNVRPSRLVVEITESVLVSNLGAAHDLLAKLDKLGVKIAIDDFGTGYSSLSYLQSMPISIVKIDRSFISGMSRRANAAVIRAVMGIGEDLGIVIVAEGVEKTTQLESLSSMGCRYVQGFLFSKPVPLTDAVAELAARELEKWQDLRARKSA